MSWQADMMGIDLNELEGERFSHPNHYAMLREHAKQVREYENTQDFEQYMHLKRLQLAQLKVEREALTEAVARNRKNIKRRVYKFTDEQLAIAIRSLNR